MFGRIRRAGGLLLMNKKLSNQSKILLIFIFLISVSHYTQALSRSDGPHMRGTLGFPIIFLSIYFINKIFQIKINFFDQINKSVKKSFFLFILIGQVFFLFLMSEFAIGYSHKAYSLIGQTINIENIKTFKSRFDKFINREDNYYLDDRLIDIVNYYRDIVKNDKCVQIFNYDTAISYLVKKQTCTRYFHVWAMGSKKNQLKFISELKISKPNFILLGGPRNYYGGTSASERLPYAYKYILDNYSKYKQIDEWIFYKIN